MKLKMLILKLVLFCIHLVKSNKVLIENENLKLIESEIEENSKISEIFPIVNKCCELGEKWMNGNCIVQIQNNSILNLENKLLIEMNKNQSVPQSLISQSQNISSVSNESLYFHYNGSISTNFEPNPILFRLHVSLPNCEDKTLLENLIEKDKLSKENIFNLNEIYIKMNYENDSNTIYLSTEGELVYKDQNGFMNVHKHDEFCIDQLNETFFTALICKPECNEKKPCIRKCCNPGSIIHHETISCVPTRNQWNPILYDNSLNRRETNSLHYIYGVPDCETYSIIPRETTNEKIYLVANGSLVTIANGQTILSKHDEFCIDGLVTNLTEPVSYSGLEIDQIALICYPTEEITSIVEDDWRYSVYSKCELISCIFLVFTGIVYLILWEYQNVHGWLQFAYVLSCFFSFAFLAIVQLNTNQIHEIDEKLCEAMGTIIHFSFLAAFSWLTSMNFDLWWTFSGCHPLRPSTKTGDKRRFVAFSIFSWGFPAIIAGTGLLLDCIYKDTNENEYKNIIRPRFGERKCYFYGSKEQLPYFYGPVGILLFIDLIFFINTVYSIQKLQKDAKLATRQSSKQDKKKFLLFMKIFIVMGVLWIFEVISWFVEVNSRNITVKNIFVPFDIINSLQGLWIFLIFTCKQNTCRQLETKFKKFIADLQKKRDDNPTSIGRQIFTCSLMPFLQSFRSIFGFCGRKALRNLESSCRTRNNTTTIHTGTASSTKVGISKKNRKFSDCSTTSTDPSCSTSYELEPSPNSSKLYSSPSKTVSIHPNI